MARRVLAARGVQGHDRSPMGASRDEKRPFQDVTVTLRRVTARAERPAAGVQWRTYDISGAHEAISGGRVRRSAGAECAAVASR